MHVRKNKCYMISISTVIATNIYGMQCFTYLSYYSAMMLILGLNQLSNKVISCSEEYPDISIVIPAKCTCHIAELFSQSTVGKWAWGHRCPLPLPAARTIQNNVGAAGQRKAKILLSLPSRCHSKALERTHSPEQDLNIHTNVCLREH